MEEDGPRWAGFATDGLAVHVRKSEDWHYRSLSDSGAVLYNPFTGDLHALPELVASLYVLLATPGVCSDVLIDATVAAYPDDDPVAVRNEVISHLSSLIQLGAILTLADQTRDHTSF